MILRLFAENLVRHGRDPQPIIDRDLDAEIEFSPSRLLMHDTTSTPALVDMAAMRDTVAREGGDPRAIRPHLPVEVSIDHSLAVEHFARRDAARLNIAEEIRRNKERYRFLKWASNSMEGIHINPPGTGIMHTINLEQLATVATTDGTYAFPDMMLGTDSHTPMINGLGVLGWGIGGVEAETLMFGMPTTLRVPEVIGVRLIGKLGAGVTSTDLALTLTSKLRKFGVTGKFVELYGPGVSTLSVGDRAVVANMAPEFGATTAYFPVDEAGMDYLAMTGRSTKHIDFVRSYYKEADLWFDPEANPEYNQSLELDLGTVIPSAAGPRRPQDLHSINTLAGVLADVEPEAEAFPLAIASTTSCTNTTDPRLLITAGLLARNARAKGLTPPSWVKTSLAPGSPAAASYLERGGLLEDLSAIGFDIVGFGCTTCIGNSGPLTPEIHEQEGKPVAVLSGNRNFPGRVHPDLDYGFLMSPPSVIAFALAGRADIDISAEALGTDNAGKPVYLRDIWPSPHDIDETFTKAMAPDDFGTDFYEASNNKLWHEIDAPEGPLFPWDEKSTILRPPPFADLDQKSLLGTYDAYPLMVLGDDITTDHISPASAIPKDSFVADFLVERGEDRDDLNVFASRRGNWEVMARGAFYSRAVKNKLTDASGIAMTTHSPSGEEMRVWDAAGRYAAENQPVVMVAGDRYGMGSSRDWAAKVQRLLGVRAVLATSYERIHRSNLIGLGILPLEIPRDFVDLAPGDSIHIQADEVSPRCQVPVTMTKVDGSTVSYVATAVIETGNEAQLLADGGVIPSILSTALTA
ncbi:aconitate hydratase AcnA [Corynebacterium casei]|uniref:aconitate hydratase AcnA n=1 Tax=Corynebacterium casei TaxID=160386 RepID=UPI003F915A4E